MATISGYVPQPNCGRGTAGIVWDCISTTAFAIWTIQHPEVVDTALKTRILHAGAVLLFPEFGAIWAIEDLARALWLRSQMKHKWADWTLKQSFAVTMGAVHVVYPRGTGRPPRLDQNDGWLIWGLKQFGFMAKRSGEGSCHDHEQESLDLSAEYKHLWKIMPEKRTLSMSTMYRDMPRNLQIDTRSATKGFTKLLALAQVIGFLLRNIIARRAGCVAISPLEVGTLAHVACALIAFAAWHQKPQNLESPFQIHLTEQEGNSMKECLTKGSGNRNEMLSYKWMVWPSLLLLGAVTAIYLVLTWNTPFPSLVDLWLWRGAHMACLLFGTLAGLIIMCTQWNSRWVGIFIFMYGLARSAVIVQSLLWFRIATSDIYAKSSWTWTEYWPGFGI